MKGRDEIARQLAERNHPDTVLVHHLFSSEVDIEAENSASGVWAMEDLISIPPGGEGEEGPPAHGHARLRPLPRAFHPDGRALAHHRTAHHQAPPGLDLLKQGATPMAENLEPSSSTSDRRCWTTCAHA